MRLSVPVLSGLLLGGSMLVACAGEMPPPQEPQPETTVTATKVEEPAPAETPTTAGAEAPAPAEEPKKEEEPPPPPKKKPTEVVSGATFAFSLDGSPDAKKLHTDECEKKAKKDEKKLEACMKDVEASASAEGVRFEKDDKGDLWWVSFGQEKGKEVVFSKIKVKVASEADDKLVLTPEGKDEGKKPLKPLPAELIVEVPDEATVVMSDPKKGKLVFKKK